MEGVSGATRSSAGAHNYRGGARISLAGATDPGRLRKVNEDSLALDLAAGLAVVADGVGGEKAGDVASAIVSRVVREAVTKRLLAIAGDYINSVRLRPDELSLIVRAALVDAHCEILEHARNNGLAGMASTAVVALVHGDLATICWAGDSSAFLARHGTITQLTRSHNLDEDMSGGSSGAKGRRAKGALTQVVGGGGDLFAPGVRHEAISAKDILLLCSDGLTDMLGDAQIMSIIANRELALDSAARALVAAANEAGGQDNITVALVGIESVPRREAVGLGGERKLDRPIGNPRRLLIAATTTFVLGLALGGGLTLSLRGPADSSADRSANRGAPPSVSAAAQNAASKQVSAPSPQQPAKRVSEKPATTGQDVAPAPNPDNGVVRPASISGAASTSTEGQATEVTTENHVESAASRPAAPTKKTGSRNASSKVAPAKPASASAILPANEN